MSKVLGMNELGWGILLEMDAGYVSHEQNQHLITENFKLNENEPVLVNCILQKWGVKNKNGRIYPKEVLMAQVAEYQKMVDSNAGTGEVDHPDSSVVSVAGTAIMITKMWWGTGDQENILYGQFKVLVTKGYIRSGVRSSPGDIIVHLLENKVRLGISSRGVGSLKEINGENLVQNDFELIGFDVVSTPSTPGSYLYPVVKDNFSENIENKKPQIKENKLIKAIDLFLD